ncbi:uncharacterized protein LOC106647225 [Copidosoma floridanum]|uniref:uncharacterized protein LOC106647225 n=1 Tax=Copidosoma floridanum TaxID=29053 RepID=UPI0006C964BB|nr:uncharacterized protein LOC106647225 [Copidosoma floridanum]
MVVLTRQRWFGGDFCINIAGHIKRAANKAAKVAGELTRLMPNVGGPWKAKRWLLALVSNSILLYGVEVHLHLPHGFLCCCYGDSPTIPVVLLALEWRRKFLSSSNESDGDRWEKSLTTWPQDWDRASVGRWTHCLILNLRPWVGRRHRQVNYNLTQFLSGHGQFDAYLHRVAVKASPRYVYCPAVVDTVEHTFFVCKRWHRECQQLVDKLGVTPTPENVISKMLRTKE